MPSDGFEPSSSTSSPKSPKASTSTIGANPKLAASPPVSFLSSNPATKYGGPSSPSGTFQVPAASPSQGKKVIRLPRFGARSDPSSPAPPGSSSQPSRFGPPASVHDVFSSPPPPPAPVRQASTPARLPAVSQPSTTSNSRPSPIDENVARFLQIPLGTELKPHIVAHDVRAQSLFDSLQIPWGVQFELARGVILGSKNNYWTWGDVIEKVEQLRGTNEVAAPKVPGVMKPEEKMSSGTDHKVWIELDREQKAILENKGRMLGLMGAWEGDSDWHGGQVQQLARLVRVEKGVNSSGGGPNLKVELHPLEKKRSHRFARFAGSRRIMQLRVPDKLLQEMRDVVKEFLCQKFILLGRVFVPFHCKDGSVYMVEIDQDYEREAMAWCGDNFRHSFAEFMQWHNPMELNSRQAISKFVTRYAIGLSNTIPVIEFKKENIHFIGDIFSSDWPVDNPKAPTEKIMTDGCGFINLAALTAITRKMGYESAPTALQGRIDGAKGLWVRHPTDDSDEPTIWIRDSQNKIKNPTQDRGHRIFELLAPSKASLHTALSMQSILNLYFNSVPEDTIVKLFREGLKEEMMPLLEWDSMVLLYDAINKAGGVAGSRMVRIAAGASVALGLQRNSWGHEDVDSEESSEQESAGPATYTGRNQYSGAPLALHESLLELIQAGFHPRESKIVRDKLQQVIKTSIKTAVEKYRIPLKDSIAAWVIPDPTVITADHLKDKQSSRSQTSMRDPLGLLKEGEVYFRSSVPMKDEHELPYYVIQGPVLLGRYPMRLPSDIQKAIAVDVPEFAQYTDVLIVSVNGTCSLPSLLSGGDMDGDIVNIFRQGELVEHFQSKPLTEQPGNLIENNFERDIISVVDFCSGAVEKSSTDAQKSYQDVLLNNLASPQKGIYSGFHDAAVATRGYDHLETIRLAYVFNQLLDASKSGLRLLDIVFIRDRKNYSSKPPPFGILARLRDEGDTIETELMATFQELIRPANAALFNPEVHKDRDLMKPYSDALAYAQELQASTDHEEKIHGKFLHKGLQKIRAHVEDSKTIFDQEFARYQDEKQNELLFSPSKSSPKGKKKSSYNSKSDQDSDCMYAAARKFTEPIEGLRLYQSNLEELKASCAIYIARPSGHFPWAVAFRGLCMLKAKAKGMAPIIREIDECKSVSSTAVKVLAKNSGGMVF
ncbi:hypothetical protein EST38_g7477 [Candolleomyces aberdarensis]|uniref:RNA-dependent RNA polymerase n=1 Tax=Candolleomyces aberdarensis TaxID=2316362 RepID=A0A4Q2DH85_9AGAR|nr:hypothetical protein EST38_g7477 [Candolleomyces aberdarensis]